jgi:hypothetical protein
VTSAPGLHPTCAELRARGGWWEDQLQTGPCEFPVAPVNTWSNAAYIAAGGLVLGGAPGWASLVMAIALTYLAVGSALYHGTKRGWAAKLDGMGMYATFGALAIHAAAPRHLYVAGAMAGFGGLTAWLVRHEAAHHTVLGVLFGLSVTLTLLQGSWVAVVVAAGLFGAAWSIWWMDRKRTFWWPRWGHGWWHILTAAALVILFLGSAQ